jgi:quinol monooxygenase YgiN
MSVLLRAEIHGLAGRAAELRDVLREHVSALARMEGSEGATASIALDAEHGEMLLESWWRDEAALRAHYATTAYRRYTQAVSPLLARPSVVVVHYVERSVHATADPAADPARLG